MFATPDSDGGDFYSGESCMVIWIGWQEERKGQEEEEEEEEEV